MPIEAKQLNALPPVLAYARLTIEMHRLIGEGKGDSEEAEALADQMDTPWYAMTAQEQSRMRGLSSDLHALREGGPKRVMMTNEQLAIWQRAIREAYDRSETGDVDGFLNLLREPVPAGLPPQVIPFLQARCWDKLGDLETALVFMKEADRLDPNQALSVFVLLQQLGRVDELPQYADRVIANPNSPPLELYLAAVALLTPTRSMSDAEARPLLQRVVPVLNRALGAYRALAPEERPESLEGDAYISQALGLGLERLGDSKSAIAVYTEAINRHPSDAELFTVRGLALYNENPQAALADFMKAVRLRVSAIWPYLLLARHALQSGASGEALRLAVAAERQPGPSAPRAEVYETIGIALAELGQPLDRVLENFDKALAFDPTNERIRENRAIAVTLSTHPAGMRAQRARLRQAPPVKPEVLRQGRTDEIKNQAESFNEQRRSRVGSAYVLA
jgi:tetratricopeptide (TPR) repeat protein